MLNKIKKFFKKKQEDVLYLKEEVKFNNIGDLKSSVDSDKVFNKKDTKETKSSLTFGK
jgi:hypothetical protein